MVGSIFAGGRGVGRAECHRLCRKAAKEGIVGPTIALDFRFFFAYHWSRQRDTPRSTPARRGLRQLGKELDRELAHG